MFSGMNISNYSFCRQKPIMHCCPQCKRPLPKCYICLSYMGLVNPQRELMVALSQTSLATGLGSQGEGALSDDGVSSRHTGMPSGNHNVLDFGKWFMWCVKCVLYITSYYVMALHIAFDQICENCFLKYAGVSIVSMEGMLAVWIHGSSIMECVGSTVVIANVRPVLLVFLDLASSTRGDALK